MKRARAHEVAPEDIFLDSSNLPEHNTGQFEGRVERPVARSSLAGVEIFFSLVVLLFCYRSFDLQVARGASYRDISINNTLVRSLVFASRGIIYDRTGVELAWNASQNVSSSTADGEGVVSLSSETPYALRAYNKQPGLAHLLGFVRYPRADAQGVWWRTDYSGVSGLELSMDDILKGVNGFEVIERDARGKTTRTNLVTPPQDGAALRLSVDSSVQSELYSLLSDHARANHFRGGAAVIIDVRTGEVLAITSFPEYNNSAFTDGNQAIMDIQSRQSDTPLLNRAVSGLYAPGSIVKPLFAAAALNEHLIDPSTQILSKGSITIPNPYDPAHPSVFHDWKVHGLIDMRTAIAVSSDEYFYTIGGGYGDQRGLGIAKIDYYAHLFGLGSTTGIALKGEQGGLIPTPAWKASVFGPNDPWRIGDTYHTVIGQYGFQLTPVQAVRAIAAIANGGHLLRLQLVASSTPQSTSVGISDSDLQVVREGMRLAVTSNRADATVKALNLPGIQIAAKTGTAQIGAHNERMNSWSVGFWPADHPHYAYAVVLESAPAGTASGAAPALAPFFQWIVEKHPEYNQ